MVSDSPIDFFVSKSCSLLLLMRSLDVELLVLVVFLGSLKFLDPINLEQVIWIDAYVFRFIGALSFLEIYITVEVCNLLDLFLRVKNVGEITFV